MWFRNLQLYRISGDWNFPAATLNEALLKSRLTPCQNSEAQRAGWVEPCEHGELVHAVNRQWLLALGVEQKLLPASVVRQFVKDRARELEEHEGRKLARKELRDLKEQITAELLPRAFVRRRITHGWIDPVNHWLVIDAASTLKAEEFIEQLRKSVDGIPVKPIKLVQSPTALMTDWVAGKEAPAGFSIDQDLELRSPSEATIRYAKHALEGDEIQRHIAEGKRATRLAMTWNDRISFVLTEQMQIKRLAFLDLIKEQSDGQSDNDAERFDIDFTLMTGETAKLLDALVEALGGEEAAAAN